MTEVRNEINGEQQKSVEREQIVRRAIGVEHESDFANGRGDVKAARGAESSADIIMADAN